MTARNGDKVKGTQFGVRLQKRGPEDQHVCIQLMGEDDDNWFNIGNPFSSFWLSDLIRTLQRAERILKTECKKDKDGWGYVFKKGPKA